MSDKLELRDVQHEGHPRLVDVKREHAAMRDELEEIEHVENMHPLTAAWKRRQRGEVNAMQYLVDAGEIVRVRDVSPRAAADLVVTMLGPRAKFPIQVHTPATGEQATFVRSAEDLETSEPAKKPIARVRQAKAKRRKHA